ncbi:MAG: recombinase family protein [Bacilli bacterium]|nr:recombinase family protein [Bacilli bacterium]
MDIFKIRNLLSQGKTIYDLPLRVTYYARVSTEMEEQLNSLNSQVMYYERLIKRNSNWIFVPGYIDEGISGASVNKRNDFLRMINDAKKDIFDLIITKEVSRFARNTMDSIGYTRNLISYGVGVYFESDNINTFESDAELRLTIMSSLAQEEIRKLSERVKFGYKRSIEKGVVAGSNNILGFKKDHGKLIIIEDEAKIVRKIYELYVYEGIGTTRLSYVLFNKYGYKNSRGKPIDPSNIRDIIRNPKYKGYYCANKSETLDFKTKARRNKPKDKWVIYKDFKNIPPIVSEELWDKANNIIEARGAKHSGIDKSVYTKRFPLSSKLFCFYDGCTFVRGNYKLKEGKKVFWSCDCYKKIGVTRSKSCNTPLLYEQELVKVFKQVIKSIIENQEFILNDIKKLISEINLQNNYKLEKIKISNQIINIEKQKDELFNMRSNNEISSGEFLDYKEKYNSKINVLKNSYNKIIDMERNTKNVFNSIDNLKNIINDILDTNDNSVLEIASSLFEKIIVETKKDKENRKKTVLHCTEKYNFISDFRG